MRPGEYGPDPYHVLCSIWCQEEDLEEAKNALKDAMEKAIGRQQEFHKNQARKYEGYAALMGKLSPTTKRQTYEERNS